MNWYKQIKIASPVMEQGISGLDYLDIGHEYSYNERGESPIRSEIWVIIPSGEILAVPRKGGNTHTTVFGDILLNSIAKGRFDEFSDGEKKASLVMDYSLKENPRKLDFQTKRVERILDRHYGNPKIYRWE